MTVRDVMLHHDNATAHKARIVMEYLRNEQVELLPHPPYNRKFGKAVQAVVEGIPKEDYENSFQSWQNRLECCIEFNGEYFEGTK
ncbi:9980_t:CDS:2 [Ambispora leptoticha]|uniref:9980_t:CDS:1 n=1 Tax=Ambispora leptoticha TaxID=144679 RepID=A0A9N8ZJQ9_9GLOM|nr:9980_t:CDS:2 [Ambispora leptoticha]